MERKRVALVSAMILLTVSLVSLACCSEEYKTYSKYGFSFEYPGDFTVTELGIEEEEANDMSGAVQVRAESGQVRGFQVSWTETIIWGLEHSLNNAFAGMERAEGIASVDRGELQQGEKAGYQMTYQHYSVTTTDGNKSYGIAAAFYFNEVQKLFTLVTTNNTVSADEDVFEDFTTYLDSFVYHDLSE